MPRRLKVEVSYAASAEGLWTLLDAAPNPFPIRSAQLRLRAESDGSAASPIRVAQLSE